jgi:hypothetical protein
MRASIPTPPNAERTGLLWDLLTFDRLLTGPVIHLIYWSGLAMICLFGFTVIGAAIGVAIRDGSLLGVLLGVPVLVGGLVAIVAGVLLWRGACEFYLAVFRIAEDLRALRLANEREQAKQPGSSSFGS